MSQSKQPATRVVGVAIVVALVSTMLATLASAQSSQAQDDLAFTPIAPCAIFDTRTGLGGASGVRTAGSITSFQVAGTSTCSDVPVGATIELNLVAVSPQSNGNLKVAASGTSPGGGVVNFATGENNSNAVPVETANSRIDVHVNSGSTHIRGVLLGYYTSSVADRLADLEARLAQTAPVAFGKVSADGTLDSLDSFNVASSQWNPSLQRYEIALADTNFNIFQFTAVASPHCGSNIRGTVDVSSVGGDMLIQIFDADSTQATTQCYFSFVVHDT